MPFVFSFLRFGLSFFGNSRWKKIPKYSQNSNENSNALFAMNFSRRFHDQIVDFMINSLIPRYIIFTCHLKIWFGPTRQTVCVHQLPSLFEFGCCNFFFISLKHQVASIFRAILSNQRKHFAILLSFDGVEYVVSMISDITLIRQLINFWKATRSAQNTYLEFIKIEREIAHCLSCSISLTTKRHSDWSNFFFFFLNPVHPMNELHFGLFSFSLCNSSVVSSNNYSIWKFYKDTQRNPKFSDIDCVTALWFSKSLIYVSTKHTHTHTKHCHF